MQRTLGNLAGAGVAVEERLEVAVGFLAAAQRRESGAEFLVCLRGVRRQSHGFAQLRRGFLVTVR